ncbi:hypothetical protein ACFPM0_19160 [Pseudonocardia sulfidoxydans]
MSRSPLRCSGSPFVLLVRVRPSSSASSYHRADPAGDRESTVERAR